MGLVRVDNEKWRRDCKRDLMGSRLNIDELHIAHKTTDSEDPSQPSRNGTLTFRMHLNKNNAKL